MFVTGEHDICPTCGSIVIPGPPKRCVNACEGTDDMKDDYPCDHGIVGNCTTCSAVEREVTLASDDHDTIQRLTEQRDNYRVAWVRDLQKGREFQAALATVTAERDAARDALERERTRCSAYEDLLRMFTRPEFVHRDDIRATAIQLATALLAETTPLSQHGTGER